MSERCPASLNCWPMLPEASRCTPLPMRKPKAEAYDYVVRAIGVSANRIVFFDDTVENIEGARARGLQAVHVKSGADLADALAVLIERSPAVEERSR